MHYSFIIANRHNQIDLHFEPTPVFSDRNAGKYIAPQVNSDSSNDEDLKLFPYQIGMFKQMVAAFQCEEFCNKNLVLVVVRSNNSNSARQGSSYYEMLESTLLQEIKAIGFDAVIIDAEDITRYNVNLNSIMGDGIDAAIKS